MVDRNHVREPLLIHLIAENRQLHGGGRMSRFCHSLEEQALYDGFRPFVTGTDESWQGPKTGMQRE